MRIQIRNLLDPISGMENSDPGSGINTRIRNTGLKACLSQPVTFKKFKTKTMCPVSLIDS
jgi:hypothetical protein